jgi:hypothetical protein
MTSVTCNVRCLQSVNDPLTKMVISAAQLALFFAILFAIFLDSTGEIFLRFRMTLDRALGARTSMATCAHGNFEQIATAIGMEVERIATHENRFEAAARWYRLDRKRPTRVTPSKTQPL